MVCVGGGIDINRLVGAAACCVCGLVSGGGGGGGVGVALLVVGGGCVLRRLGVWASLRVVWVLRLRALQSLRFLSGCGVEVLVGGGGVRWSVCREPV